MLLKKGLQKYNLISYNAVDYKRNNTPYTLINKNTYNFPDELTFLPIKGMNRDLSFNGIHNLLHKN